MFGFFVVVAAMIGPDPAHVVPGAAVAEAMASCGQCNDIEPPWGTQWHHYFTGSSCSGSGLNGCMDCALFNSCHTNSQGGTCWAFHFGCGGGGQSLGLPTLQRIEQAVAAADFSALRGAPWLEGVKLHFNPSRWSIQVEGCAGEIVADYPVPQGADLDAVSTLLALIE